MSRYSTETMGIIIVVLYGLSVVSMLYGAHLVASGPEKGGVAVGAVLVCFAVATMRVAAGVRTRARVGR